MGWRPINEIKAFWLHEPRVVSDNIERLVRNSKTGNQRRGVVMEGDHNKARKVVRGVIDEVAFFIADEYWQEET